MSEKQKQNKQDATRDCGHLETLVQERMRELARAKEGLEAEIGERRRAEEALRKSEEDHRTLIAALPDIIMRFDADCRFLFTTENVASITSIPAAAYVGKTYRDLGYPEPLCAVREHAIRQPFITARPYETEIDIDGPFGRRTFNWRLTPDIDDTGRVRTVLAVARDITAQKRYENRMKRLTETILSFGVNPVENIGRLTGLCGELLGAACALYNRLEEGMLCSKGMWRAPQDYVPVDKPDGHICYDVIQKSSEDVLVVRNLPGTPYFQSDPNVRRYNLETYMGKAVLLNDKAVGSLCVVFQKDVEPEAADEELLKIIAAAISIEERRQHAEVALRDSEKKYRELINSMNDTVWVIDPDTTILDMNTAAATVLGYTRDELLSMKIPDIDVDLKPEQIESLAGSMARDKLQVFETVHTTKDGRKLPVEVSSSLVSYRGRTVILSIARDISERKRLEAELIKTQKLEAIGTLAGGIAHDFNNLLQGVFGYISLAKLTVDDRSQCTHALEQAEKALHMSVKLTSQLLTFSKGGKPVIQTIDLLPVIENAANFTLSGSRTVFNIASDSGLWKGKADEGQISQVVQNIVLNADQAMPEGGRIEITAKNVRVPGPDAPKELEQGRYIEIAITDTGIGIPENYLRKIFDPYFTTKEKGSGLGLTTAYSIIKNHKGAMDVQSMPGAGTKFRFYVPAAEAMTSATEASPLKAAAVKKSRILVMDDEPLVLNIAEKLLSALGHEADLAVNGAEALDKYQEAKQARRPYDILILDLTVRGGMGGVETIRKLFEMDPNVKAIVSSGYSDDAAMAAYKDMGFKAILNKPYNIVQLKETLERLLSGL